MNQKKEPVVFPPDADTILEDFVRRDMHDIDDTASETLNRVERALMWAGVLLPGNGYPAGLLNFNFSRTKRVDVPAKGEKEKPIADVISDKYALCLRELLGEEVPTTDCIRRLLDKPDICDRLIHHARIQDRQEFEAHLANSYYEFGRHRLAHTKNQFLHHQKAGVGSYISRAFAPDDFPPIRKRTNTEKEWTQELRDSLIKTMPIDPRKVASETLIKLGLVPEDFLNLTESARLRWTLAVRKRFLTIFSQAREITRADGTKTARIVTVETEDGKKKIAIFRTTSDLHTHTTGQEKPKKSYQKVSKTYCSIFEGREEALRSQLHAIEGLTDKIYNYAFLLEAWSHYEECSEEEIAELIRDSFEITKTQESFYDRKLVSLLSKFVNEKNRFTRGHIVDTLFAAFASTEAKITEIRTVHALLSEAKIT